MQIIYICKTKRNVALRVRERNEFWDWQGAGGEGFCPVRSAEHYDNVQCRVGIHCTLSNRPRSLPGLLSCPRGVRNKQARAENSSSLSVLSIPPLFSLFSFIRTPRRVLVDGPPAGGFCSCPEKRKIRHWFATETLLAPISSCCIPRCTYPWLTLDLSVSKSRTRSWKVVDLANYTLDRFWTRRKRVFILLILCLF